MGIFDKTRRVVEIEVHSGFAEKLVAARIKTGKTQEFVSKALGKSRSALANWEVGRSLPDLPTFVEWCKLMDTTPNDVLGFGEK